jgi:hypothetical protein
MLLIRVLQGKRGCRVFRALSGGGELAAELHSAQSGMHGGCPSTASTDKWTGLLLSARREVSGRKR